MKNKRLRTKLAIAALATCVMGTGTAYAAYNKVAGPQTDGTAYTPNGWHVTPVGIQKPAGFFPANAVLSPDGKAVLVPDIIKNGNNKQAVQVLDAKDGGLIQEIELSGTGQGVAPGLAFSHDGSRVYLATANMNSVIVFGWNSVTSKLTQQKTLTLPGGTYPQGVAVSPDDKTLYESGAYKKTLVAVDVASGSTATGDRTLARRAQRLRRHRDGAQQLPVAPARRAEVDRRARTLFPGEQPDHPARAFLPDIRRRHRIGATNAGR